MPNIIYKEEGYAILGACFEVYNEMGCGFLESVYQEALDAEFRLRSIPFVAQQELNLYYKGQLLETRFKPDFVCFDKIIVELKAVKQLLNEHRAQVLNYLKATSFKLALLVNFGQSRELQYERLVR